MNQDAGVLSKFGKICTNLLKYDKTGSNTFKQIETH